MITETAYRRTLLLGSRLALGAAGVVVAGVIPPVIVDPISRAAAIPALFVVALLDVLVAAAMHDRVTRREVRVRRWLLGLAGLLGLILSLGLTDAALAMLNHGPWMRFVAVELFACVAATLTAGVLSLTGAILRPSQAAEC